MHFPASLAMLLFFTTFSLAHPLQSFSFMAGHGTDKLHALQGHRIDNHFPWWQQSNVQLSNLTLPTAPAALPTPSTSLIHIGLGRGTQNYSCPSTANSTTVPVSTGAVATLYNITSFRLHANTSQNALLTAFVTGSTLTSYALGLPDPSASACTANCTGGDNGTTNGSGILDLPISGHHYFNPSSNTSNAAAPISHFDLGLINLGSANAAKIATSAAPVIASFTLVANTTTTSPVSKMPATDIPWLYLRALTNRNASSAVSWKEVYRVNTRGGVAPASCDGLEGSTFVVEYAAEYWFFG